MCVFIKISGCVEANSVSLAGSLSEIKGMSQILQHRIVMWRDKSSQFTGCGGILSISGIFLNLLVGRREPSENNLKFMT
jgi:actin-related protein